MSGQGPDPPNLSMTLAVLLAFAAFGTFAAFIAHILRLQQPTSVISSIHDDAVRVAKRLYPDGSGEPDDSERSALLAAAAVDGASPGEVHAGSSGYLAVVDTDSLIKAASECGAVVRQCVPIGDYVVPGQPVAQVFTAPGEPSDGPQPSAGLAAAVRDSFVLGKQRTLVQDIAFPVRQLADIALKGLSPGINDPATAENAIDSMGSFLVGYTRCERPSPIRADEAGEPRPGRLSAGVAAGRAARPEVCRPCCGPRG